SPWGYVAAGVGGLALGCVIGSNRTPTYSNPYAGSGSHTTVVYNYAQPIASPSVQGGPAPPSDSSVKPEVTTAFDQARHSFHAGQYQAALHHPAAAIKTPPPAAVLQEFRALCLFALGHYDEAAAALYGVLAAGPGWDWETVS